MPDAEDDDMGMAQIDDSLSATPEPPVDSATSTAAAETAQDNSDVDHIDALLEAVSNSSDDDEDFDIDALLAEEGGLDISSDDAVEKMK
jgi:hypothetical protein